MKKRHDFIMPRSRRENNTEFEFPSPYSVCFADCKVRFKAKLINREFGVWLKDDYEHHGLLIGEVFDVIDDKLEITRVSADEDEPTLHYTILLKCCKQAWILPARLFKRIPTKRRKKKA